MALPFSRSLRALEADGSGAVNVAFLVVAVLAGAWLCWFTLARVTVVEVAQRARLEVDQAAHRIDAPVAGKITAWHLSLNAPVRAGDVVAELDTQALELALAQESARGRAVGPQSAALVREIQAEEQVLADERRAAGARIGEARARSRELESAEQFARQEVLRLERMQREGLAAGADVLRARSEHAQRYAALDAARASVLRTEAEQRALESERRALLAGKQRQLAELDGQRERSAAAALELAHEIGRRRIRAPVSGRLGEVASLRVGAVVVAGERLGAVIPPGTVHVVGEFAPAAAAGRLRPGQAARMRPDGFPWTQYGMLSARVRRVAREARDGVLRVELDVEGPDHALIPVEHGLPGTLEVEVERVSPAALVFRLAGRRLAAPTGRDANAVR